MPRDADGRYGYEQALSSVEGDRLMESIRWLLLAAYLERVAHRIPDCHMIEARRRKPIRMAFMVDIVGYGRRDSPAKESLQQRLADVVRTVLAEVDFAVSDAELQGTGDGILVILPERLDIQRGSAVLLRSFEDRLVHDNGVFQDRMRVRMAADVGPVSPTELGFGGAMVTKIGRMLDSKRLRRSVNEYPERDLLVVLSDALHGFVVAETVLGLQEKQFTRVHIRAKELSTTAWLWTH